MNTNISEIARKSTTRVKSIAMHPKYMTFITGHYCGTINLWDLNYLSIVGLLGSHNGSVRCVSFHTSGKFFASCGDDKIVRIWNYNTRNVICELHGHSQTVRSVCFHSSRPWIVSGSDDCTVKLWDYETGNMLSSSSGHSHYVMSVVFLDNEHIGSGSMDQTINIWKISEPEKRKNRNVVDRFTSLMMPNVVLCRSIEGHQKGIKCLSTIETMTISGGDDGEIKLWKWENGDLTYEKSIEVESAMVGINGVTAVTVRNNIIILSVGDNGVLKLNSVGITNNNINSTVRDDSTNNILGENGYGSIKCDESRLWAVGAKKNYVVVGSDDGLVVYCEKSNIAGRLVGNNIFYSNKRRLMCYDIDKKKASEICNLKENATRILYGRKSSVVVEYGSLDNKPTSHIECFVNKEDCEYGGNKNNRSNCKNKHVSNHNNTFSEKKGQCGYVNGLRYEIKKNTLFRDGVKLLDNIDGTLVPTDHDIFVLNGNIVRNEVNILMLPFSPFDVVTHGDEIAFIGRNKIMFYDRNMRLKSTLEEHVEITGAFYTKNSNDTYFFVYGTLRNVKYVYKDIGILLSVEEYLIPIGLRNNELYLLDKSGIRLIAVNTTEVAFRKAVCEDGDIIGFIKENNLPGISPLKYLVAHGKGVVALSYIDDILTKFDLFVSSEDFEKAYEICADDKMRDKLAFSAMAAGDYVMAETCWDEIGSTQNLFYLFLCTKQFDKISRFKDENILAAIFCEDRISINTLLGYSVFSSIETNLDNLHVPK